MNYDSKAKHFFVGQCLFHALLLSHLKNPISKYGSFISITISEWEGPPAANLSRSVSHLIQGLSKLLSAHLFFLNTFEILTCQTLLFNVCC